MHLTIILSIIISVYFNFSFSQVGNEKELMNLEYQIFTANNDTLKNELLLTKFNLLIQDTSKINESFEVSKRIKLDLINHDVKNNYLWNVALISYLNSEFTYANIFLSKYERVITVDTNYLMLKYLTSVQLNNDIQYEIYDSLIELDSIFINFDCLKNFLDYTEKHKKIKLLISQIIPGSGMIANGNLFKGFTSLTINLGTILAIRYFYLSKAYLNMISWGNNLITKFYLGNVTLTNKLIIQKENIKKNKLANSCELVFENILNKYPLNFR